MTVIDYLERSADRHPGKTAFSDAESSITYADLLPLTKRIATGLLRRFPGSNQPVAVMVDRNIESLCAFLGIAMSRNFYVPIDAGQPFQRVMTILDQMRPAAIVTFSPLSEEFMDISVPVLDYSSLASETEDDDLLLRARLSARDDDPLFAICTSGSTGTPKGVIKSHRSVTTFIPVFAETFGFTEEEIFGNQAPFDFDVSAKDIYSTLYCGASLYIIPRVAFVMPKKLVEELDDRRITTLIWSVSALCVAAGLNAFKYRVPGSIKRVLFSGEVMPVKMLNVWRQYLPDAIFVNMYGPTEVTGNSMYYIVDREFENTETLPLGIPFRNGDVFFLDENDRPIGMGESGEICIQSTSLAIGYYRDSERTAASFTQNPLNDRYPERIYRTGDLAELREDGQYYFVGRKDFQIKHMGHRIELEEIETHINAVPGIRRGCCLFDTQSNKIVACYSGDPDRNDVYAELKKHLPKYMIPSILIKTDEIPLNKNGKLDRETVRKRYLEGSL